jgi:hypothetical protein
MAGRGIARRRPASIGEEKKFANLIGGHIMTISSGNLDSLLNASFAVDTLANLTYLSGTAANGAPSSVTARTGSTTYPGFDSLKVASVTDSNNTIEIIGYESDGGYGGTTAVPWFYTVVGMVGNDLLLAANGAAAVTPLPASTVASYIQGNNGAALSSDLFVFATDGTHLGTMSGQTLTFGTLDGAAETVAVVTASAPSTAVTVTDSAAAVQGGLDMLQSLAAGGKINAITLTDAGTPTLSLTDAQLSGDAVALSKISGAYGLSVTGATVATTGSAANTAHVMAIQLTDSAGNVVAALDPLQAIAAKGLGLSISLSDSGIPNLSLSATQLAADSGVLKDITSDFTITVDGSAANITAAGIAGRGTIVKFTGVAADYTVTPGGDGVDFTVTDSGTGRVSTDHLGTITALQFSDFTAFIADAPSASGITTGNVTELYSAVLARTPDVAGLAFYQAAIAKTPGLTMNQLAQYFLSSPEYQNNSAHNYAQTAAGDAQFITDTYTNLLHRSPDTGAIPFYQAVINQFTANVTPGTAAYTAAELAGHAQILVYFSASPEFLSDVQITAQHPADAQHFLYLI